MNKIAIITDSSCNLSTPLQKEFGVDDVLPMHIYFVGKEIDCNDDWPGMSAKEYYDYMRAGEIAKSSQVQARQYRDSFVKFLDQGYDVLSISCTSALSASVKESYTVRDELAPLYPNQKIRCIDSANCTFNLAMLIKEASKLRSEGKEIDEIVKWIEDNKLFYNEVGTVEKLTYLHQAGRISASKAFFGGILGVKPIVINDIEGHNVAVEKVKGRKNSFIKLVDYLKEYGLFDECNDIYIAHADCIDDANEVKGMIEEAFPGKLNYTMAYVGQGVGSSVGPGTIIISFKAKKEMREFGEKSK